MRQKEAAARGFEAEATASEKGTLMTIPLEHITAAGVKRTSSAGLDVYLAPETRRRIKAPTPGGESRAVHRFLDLPASFVFRLWRWLEDRRSGSFGQLRYEFDTDPVGFACSTEVFVGALMCVGYERAGERWERR